VIATTAAAHSSDVHTFLLELAVFVVGTGVVATLGWLVHAMKTKVIAPLQQVPAMIKRQEETGDKLDVIVGAVETLSPNGGSSLRDSIDRIERRVAS
jgi:hypothetical protein